MSEGTYHGSSELTALIAHVVYFDCERYSLMHMEDRDKFDKEILRFIKELSEYQTAIMRDAVIPLDSGDGMALVFLEDPQLAAGTALSLTGFRYGDRRLRIGVHCGPVTLRQDISGKRNVSGPGIEIASRVMSVSPPGSALLSATFAEMIGAFETWRNLLSDEGTRDVKHSVKIHVFRLQSTSAAVEAVGSRENAGARTFRPEDLKPIGRRNQTRTRFWLLSLGLPLAVAASLLLITRPAPSTSKQTSARVDFAIASKNELRTVSDVVNWYDSIEYWFANNDMLPVFGAWSKTYEEVLIDKGKTAARDEVVSWFLKHAGALTTRRYFVTTVDETDRVLTAKGSFSGVWRNLKYSGTFTDTWLREGDLFRLQRSVYEEVRPGDPANPWSHEEELQRAHEKTLKAWRR